MVSIVIPSRGERFLKKTIEDVLSKAAGEIEIFPVLDGHDLLKEEIVVDPRVKYIRLPKSQYPQKRHGVNTAAIFAQGKYFMSLDAHCMVGRGFDKILAKDCEENWVVIPRRKRLDGENWCIQPTKKPDIDYEFFANPFCGYKVKSIVWTKRAIERKNIPIDENLMFQGSCWFMHKSHFKRNGFMQIEGYTGWGQNEAEEIGLKTWLGGGKVMTNKKTWYAHLRKGKKYGRGYSLDWSKVREGNKYSQDFWLNDRWKNRKHNFSWLIERFWPVPTWEKWKP